MRHTHLAIAAFLALAAPGASAGDPALEALIKAADIPFEVDKDGDYKIVYDWSKDKRSQLVYVSGTVEELDGVKLYEIFLLKKSCTISYNGKFLGFVLML